MQPLLWVLCAISATLSACAWLPAEFNLSPLYRQRLDESGQLLELDVLWPLVHYERTADGGDDFRVRPFYRRVTEGPGPSTSPTHEPGATEHQFLWPLGRIRHADGEVHRRLFPLYQYTARVNSDGEAETDWYCLFPFVWGGSGGGGREDYLAVFPFYADIPNFLTYDRFQTWMFPIYVRTEKNDKTGHLILWPLVSFGSSRDGSSHWHRVLPIYSVSIDEQRYQRYAAPWPFVHWNYENLDTDSPVSQFFLFPIYGHMRGPNHRGWTLFWPLFQDLAIADRYRKVDILWPLFRWLEDRAESSRIRQWWFWPFLARTITDDQRSWSVLWPLIWWRSYDDPEGMQEQKWILPFYWRVHRQLRAGGSDDFVKLWPLMHAASKADGSGEWNLLSPWPWREGNAYGVDEAYGWLWSLAKGRRRTAEDESFELWGNLFTSRTRSGKTSASVPFLFNYTDDSQSRTLRLFHLFPIRLGNSNYIYQDP